MICTLYMNNNPRSFVTDHDPACVEEEILENGQEAARSGIVPEIDDSFMYLTC